MIPLTCTKCGKFACWITPPTLTKGEAFAMKTAARGFGGLDVGGMLGALHDGPALSVTFAVLCTTCDHG